PRPQAERSENRRPTTRIVNDPFSFESLFEAGPALAASATTRDWCGRLAREDRADRSPRGRWSLDTKAQEPAARAKSGIGRVVKGVLFEHAAMRHGPETMEPPEQREVIHHAELDLDFAISGTPDRAAGRSCFTRAHRSSISRRNARPRTEESCQTCAGASIIASLPHLNARK